MAEAWQINIVGHDVKPASWFLGNSRNVRIHPRAQQDATEGSLNALGWVKSVTVNKRTSAAWGPQDRGVETLLDGHERIMLALRRGDETPVPLEWVDLDPEGEDLFLAIIDELVNMAMKDKGKLDALLRDVKPADASLQQMLSELAAREGLYTGNGVKVDDPMAEWQGMPEFVHEDKTAFQTIALHFKDQQAINEFAELVGQKITPKTRFLWYPEQEIIRYGDAE